jgi:hypothetical protein
MFHSEFDNIAGPPAQSEQVSTGKASVPAITDRGTAGCRHESSDAPSCSATDREAPAFCAPRSAPHDSAMVAQNRWKSNQTDYLRGEPGKARSG